MTCNRLLVLLLLATTSLWAQQSAVLRPAVPTEPIAAIIDAFRTHRVVAMSAGAGHEDDRGPAFVVSLIRDPRFAATVNDVVMEGTNARYQDVMDRYVRGEQLAGALLRPAWEV